MYAILVFDDNIGGESSFPVGYFIGFYTHQGERFVTYAKKTEPNASLIKKYKSRKRAEKAIENILNKSSIIGLRFEVEEWSDLDGIMD